MSRIQGEPGCGKGHQAEPRHHHVRAALSSLGWTLSTGLLCSLQISCISQKWKFKAHQITSSKLFTPTIYTEHHFSPRRCMSVPAAQLDIEHLAQSCSAESWIRAPVAENPAQTAGNSPILLLTCAWCNELCVLGR